MIVDIVIALFIYEVLRTFAAAMFSIILEGDQPKEEEQQPQTFRDKLDEKMKGSGGQKPSA
jgi:hypothetical protein